MLDVLVVDDDQFVRGSIAEAIAAAGHHVEEACDGAEALSLLAKRPFDLAVCDVQMPNIDGLTLFRRLRRDSPDTAVILMTSFGKVRDVVATIRDGAADYVTKPFDPDEFTRDVVGPIDERRRHFKQFDEARSSFIAREAGDRLVGTSLEMRQLAHRVAIIGKTDTSVLISGEPGTGKKLIARTLHAESARREGPLVIMPCAAMSESALESLLTHAAEHRAQGNKDDWFSLAEGGTLVLDGIDHLSLHAQAVLLRIIDDPAIHARRDRDWRPVGARLLAVSRDTSCELLGSGRFLTSLIYRLNTVQMAVPPLRARDGDIYALTCQFLRDFAPQGAMPIIITPAAVQALCSYEFPGNVGELHRALESALAVARGGRIDVHHLPSTIAGPKAH